MDYSQAWQYLDNLQFFKIKLGLDSMNAFLERLHSPQQKLKFVHVGGTNGKGSVASSILSILAKAGYRVGLYTSPHLTSVRERFRINNEFISRDDFARTAENIIDTLDGDQITYFEFTTALALSWFAEQKVDLAILEVGLGGRLDATNVVEPLVSVITNVSMDHETYLGDTIAQVAAEKAGIIKKGCPLVTGVTDPVAGKVIAQKANAVQTQISKLHKDFTMTPSAENWLFTGESTKIDGLQLSLLGTYQPDNAAVALAAVEKLQDCGFTVKEQDVQTGLAAVRWPGRLEFFEKKDASGITHRYLLDGAHNPAGVEALVDSLKAKFTYNKLIMVWGSMADKDIGKCLRQAAPMADQIIFTRPEENRSATANQLKNALIDYAGDCHTSATVEEALELAGKLAGNNDLICVAGSLYLVGKARAILLGNLIDD